MTWRRVLVSRLIALFRKGRLEQELDEELRSHLEMQVGENIRKGMSPHEARYAALRSFGGVEQVKEIYREQRGLPMIETLLQDIRYCLRQLRHSPAFATTAVFTLALGIGANTAMFSVVNAVLLRPLVYPDPERIVAVETFWKNLGRSSPNVSAPDFHDWRTQSTVFSALAYYSGGRGTVVVNGAAEYANNNLVTPDFFSVFGLSAAAGHFFTAAGQRDPVAVVSYNWAETHFGSVSTALGQKIKLRGNIVEVIGVAAPGFRYLDVDIWAPAGLVPENPNRTGHNYWVVGRLKPGVTLEAAQEQMKGIGDRIERDYPENRFKNVALIPLQDKLTAPVRATLWVLLGAVSLVLLIACANVANLLLARAAARTREIALRAALGASRGRVVRQLFTESLLLAFVSSAAGVGMAHLLLVRLLALAPANLPRLEGVRIDTAVLLFTLATSVLATLLFGLAPALQGSRPELTEALKQSGSRGTIGGGKGRLRSALVIAEVALSMVLLAGAGLLLRSFERLQQVDLGFATDHVLVAQASYSGNSEESLRRASEFYRDLLTRVRALPGVTQAAGMRLTPLTGSFSNGSYFIAGKPEGRPGEQPNCEFQVVTEGFFATLGTPVKQGRDFTDGDNLERPLVAIINESFAGAAFPGENPLGHRVKCGFLKTTKEWMEIIGVVGDTRRFEPGRPPVPELFIPALQHPVGGSSLSLVVRTSLEPTALAAPIRDIVREQNPEVPVRFETMDQVFARSLSYPRFRALLVGAFAGLAAVLAFVGIYSVLTYLVGQRRSEFGVRMALGAKPQDLVRLVVGDGLRMVAAGILAGIAGAFALNRVLSNLLYGLSASDPMTYFAVIVLVTAVTLLASGLPALRAASVDPLVALRQQ
jgi:putative ABC transport system permease protein